MKEKTARRFLRRNGWNIIKLNQGEDFSPSFKKRIKECIRVLSK